MFERFSEKINIILIYISEAHAADEWPVSNINKTPQHKSIQDRITACREVKLPNGLKIYCDSLEERNFESTYSAWPERALLVEGNVLKYISQREVDGVDDWKTEVIHYLS
jgi:hypothetical protein